MTDVADRVAIKGGKDGIVLHFPDQGEWADLMIQLHKKLAEGEQFFGGSGIVADFGTRALQETEMAELRAALDARAVSLTGVLCDSPVTKLLAQQQAIPVLTGGSIIHSQTGWRHPVRRSREAGTVRPISGHQPPPAVKPSRRRAPGMDHEGSRSEEPVEGPGNRPGKVDLPAGHRPALLVRRTLRAGQRVNVAGSVAILGDVNPGAEVTAGGDILVFGTLRGIAHAGAGGDEDAVVSALTLQPTQLRIATHIARPPEDPRAKRKSARSTVDWRPEIARVRDGAIVIDPYQHHEGK